MMGGAFGGSITEIAKQALSTDRIPNSPPPKDVSSSNSSMGGQSHVGFDVSGFFNNAANNSQGVSQAVKIKEKQTDSAPIAFCSDCGAKLVEGAMFCPRCGKKQASASICTGCGKQLESGQLFCPYCGTKA